MSAADVYHLATCITAHAWNGDRTKVAICPNSNEVHIYGKSGANFTLEHILAEHDQVVTGIDWAAKTNRIVTSSQDRNAYVWTAEAGTWKPILVILRINRAATHVKWSPEENKFAVASGAKCVSVCYFEEENNWWVSKHIKKHRSTVLKVDWHPNNMLLATGSSDFKTRVFSAFIKGVDSKPPNGPFGTKLPFGELLLELDAFGWVHAVKWSPSGNRLAFAGHDSTITFADVSSLPPKTQRIRLFSLPLRDIVFLSEQSLVGVGEDTNPVLFTATDSGEWSFGSELDKSAPVAADPATLSARKAFQNRVELGDSSNDTKIDTLHQNSITVATPFATSGSLVTDFSTSGLDGNLIVWHVKAIESKLGAIKIK
jgi:actin related protein 2/3 complex subunit 1A/1B